MPNIFEKVGKAIGSVAPIIGKALTNPVGLAGELAGKVVKDILGLGGDASEQEILDAVKNMTPEQRLAFQKAENDFSLTLVTLEQKDKESARDLAKTQGLLHHSIITYVFLVGFFGVEVATRFGAMSPGDGGWQEVMVFAFGVILTFWFGSSFGSKVKDGTEAMKAKMGLK